MVLLFKSGNLKLLEALLEQCDLIVDDCLLSCVFAVIAPLTQPVIHYFEINIFVTGD